MIRNFTQPNRIHAERIRIGFSYNDPPNLARQVLKSTALETKGILLEPEPEVFTLNYDDSAVTYEVKFFIRDYGDVEQIRERFMTRVWYAAKRSNLTIPFPIRTVYNFHGPSSQQKGIDKKFSESLQAIPSFVPINRDHDSLAPSSSGIALQHFAAGEKIIRQGQVGQALYIIVAGLALMSSRQPDGQEREILSLSKGEFFCEMSLFSGEPSVVSVIACNDLEVMKISAAMVHQMIDRQPSFAREIGQILEIRRAAILESSQSPGPSRPR
jgi:hypothetical protein